MKQFALFGNPVEHSLSPLIHQAFAEQTGIELSYEKILVQPGEFENAVRVFQTAGGNGANITLPYKIAAFELADEHSKLATEAGAANTFLFREDGSIFADCTDGIGLVQDLKNNHHYSLCQKKILLIGAGGAARTTLGALLAQAPSSIHIANRTKQKAQDIAASFTLPGEIMALDFNELDAGPYDLIINATSAGLTGEFPSLPADLVGEHTWCYDMLYATTDTPFLTWCKSHGPAQAIDGKGMLVEQAAASFYLWNGVYPETQSVIGKVIAA